MDDVIKMLNTAVHSHKNGAGLVGVAIAAVVRHSPMRKILETSKNVADVFYAQQDELATKKRNEETRIQGLLMAEEERIADAASAAKPSSFLNHLLDCDDLLLPPLPILERKSAEILPIVPIEVVPAVENIPMPIDKVAIPMMTDADWKAAIQEADDVVHMEVAPQMLEVAPLEDAPQPQMLEVAPLEVAPQPQMLEVAQQPQMLEVAQQLLVLEPQMLLVLEGAPLEVAQMEIAQMEMLEVAPQLEPQLLVEKQKPYVFKFLQEQEDEDEELIQLIDLTQEDEPKTNNNKKRKLY